MNSANLAFTEIQNDLRLYGLNPRDWAAHSVDNVTSNADARLVLVHRDDEDVRLAVNVRRNSNSDVFDISIESPSAAIEEIEWLVS